MSENHEIRLGDIWDTSINNVSKLPVVIMGINDSQKLVKVWPIIDSDIIKSPGVKANTVSGRTVQVIPSFAFSFNESLLDHPLGESISTNELIEINFNTDTRSKQGEDWDEYLIKTIDDSITDLAENEIGESIGSLPFDVRKLHEHDVRPSDIIKYVEDNNDDSVISMDRARGLLEGKLVPNIVEAYDVAEGISRTEDCYDVVLLPNEVEDFLNKDYRKIIDGLSDPIWKNDVQSIMRSMNINEASARKAIMEGVLSNGGSINVDNQQVNKMIEESVASILK